MFWKWNFKVRPWVLLVMKMVIMFPYIVFSTLMWQMVCADPESFVRGSYFDNVFFYSWWGEGWSKYHYKRAIIGPPAKHFFCLSLACQWWLAWRLCDLQGIWTSIAEKPYIFVIFQGGSGPPVPPLWIRQWMVRICSGKKLEIVKSFETIISLF